MKKFYLLFLVLIVLSGCEYFVFNLPRDNSSDNVSNSKFGVTVKTNSITEITKTTAKIEGEITSDGVTTITQRGVCLSINENPTIDDNFEISIGTTGNYTCEVSSLTPGTKYYVKAFADTKSGIIYGNQKSFTTTENSTLTIGENYEGGIIFYIDPTGQHGLVCAETDQSSGAQWEYCGSVINGADGTAIGTGNQNTIDIVNNCYDDSCAASICSDLVLNSYEDWFLPSKEELILMYDNLYLNNLGSFSADDYWSSSEKSETYAWFKGFYLGTTGSTNKGASLYVRAVRSF